MWEAFDLAKLVVAGNVREQKAVSALIRAGTQIIPGERVIKEDEIFRMWDHAMFVKQAEWEAEHTIIPDSAYGEDVS